MDRSSGKSEPRLGGVQAEAASRGVAAGAEPSHMYLEAVRSFCAEDYEGARRRFHSMLLTEPGDATLLAACGHCALHEGDKGKAAEFYDRAEGTQARLPDVTYSRAILLMHEGRREEAASRLEALSASPPPIAAGSFYLGLLFNSTEEFLCTVRLHLGQIHLELDRGEVARHWYERALEAMPNNVTAHQRLGELAILGKKYIEAIGHLDRVLEISRLEEDWVNAHNTLGIACYENGMLEDAIIHLTWVLKRAPSNPTAIYNLNFIYEKEGVFQRGDRSARGIRFVDVAEGALPIFELADTQEDQSRGGVTIIGRSNEMLRVMRLARIAASRESHVLIRGENGTGKELLAQLITLNSSRRDGPFSVVNCASMPEVLLECELFGYEKGAFTGARAAKQGRFELAQGGTLFLDEITALTPMLQGKVYRALQDGVYTRVGGTAALPVTARIIAATNRDLHALAREGSFREDLFYLLNVIAIDVPPLRDRAEDIPLLVEYFFSKYARHPASHKLHLSEEDLQTLMEYEWPGNVRELENLIERAVVMGSQSSLYLEELVRLRRKKHALLKEPLATRETAQYPLSITLAELEKRHILSVMESCEQNQRRAAEILGINPSTLWRKLKSYEGGGAAPGE